MKDSALLIVDMQNDYFTGGKMELVNIESVANNAKILLDSFRKRELPVLHIKHISLKPTATFFLPGTS